MSKLNESEQQKVKLTQKMYRARKESSAQEMDLEFLEKVESSDIIIVKGSYDYIENVFELIGIPYTLIEPEQVRLIELKPEQIVFVNCPGQIDMTGVEKLVGFVKRGGYMITTDWALKNVLERGFPGIVEYNNQPTGDEVVRIEVKEWDNPIIKNTFNKEDDPLWWLEGSSYPIKIIDKEKVEILVVSKELGEKYGEDPVVVSFWFEEGRIYHMISHFYLQKTETRSERHSQKASFYAAEKGVTGSFSAEEINQMDTMNVGEMESAYTTQSFINELIIEKKKKESKK